MNGMPEIVSAAEVPIIATMSGSFSRSWLSTVQTTWVSLQKPGHEQRPDRPVDQPRYQRLLFRGPALALEKAAGDLAGGKRLFLVIDRQREKILARLCRFRRDGGAKDRRFAIGREHCAVRLPGYLAGLKHEAAAAPHQFLTKYLKHPLSSFQTNRRRDRRIPRAVRRRAVPPPLRSLPAIRIAYGDFRAAAMYRQLLERASRRCRDRGSAGRRAAGGVGSAQLEFSGAGRGGRSGWCSARHRRPSDNRANGGAARP